MTVRVVVVEDSPTARALIVAILESDPMLQVVGQASNGSEAFALAKRLRPDVMTLDIHMPEVGGLEAIRRIMSEAPTPIVVVSETVGPHDVAASVRALGAGALAALPKPSGPDAPDFLEQSRQLTMTVKSMAEVKVVRRWSSTRPRPAVVGQPSQQARIVAVAASTGGPAALYRLLSELPRDFPLPILIVQHIAHGFLQGLVDWWGSSCAIPVKIAEPGDRLTTGGIYVAPDHGHLGVDAKGSVAISTAGPIGGHRPSANFLFESVTRTYGASAVGVIMTGMGQDGVDGLQELKMVGGYVIAQDEETSVVFGMPGAAARTGLVDVLLPPSGIATHLQRLLERTQKLGKTS
jgi:two-component system chemotaxis response regulator CheB